MEQEARNNHKKSTFCQKRFDRTYFSFLSFQSEGVGQCSLNLMTIVLDID